MLAVRPFDLLTFGIQCLKFNIRKNRFPHSQSFLSFFYGYNFSERFVQFTFKAKKKKKTKLTVISK